MQSERGESGSLTIAQQESNNILLLLLYKEIDLSHMQHTLSSRVPLWCQSECWLIYLYLSGLLNTLSQTHTKRSMEKLCWLYDCFILSEIAIIILFNL